MIGLQTSQFCQVLRVTSALVAVVQDLSGCMTMLTTGPSSPPFLPQWSMGRQMLPSSPCPSSQDMQVCLSSLDQFLAPFLVSFPSFPSFLPFDLPCHLPSPSLPFPPLPSPPLPSPPLPFPSLPFPSLPFPSLPFPSLPFPSLPFLLLPFCLPCVRYTTC